MSTIAENLQIIKDSTEAIKQAIIDKGGTITGDITTYADAISELSDSNSEEEVLEFIVDEVSDVSIVGTLNKIPYRGKLVLIYTSDQTATVISDPVDSDTERVSLSLVPGPEQYLLGLMFVPYPDTDFNYTHNAYKVVLVNNV